MAAAPKKCERGMVPRGYRVATDTEARRMTGATRLAIKRCLATVYNVGKTQDLVGAWAHGAVTTDTLIHCRIDKALMTRATQALRCLGLFVVEAGKPRVMHEILGNRMRRQRPHISPDRGVTNLAFFRQISRAHPFRLIMTRGTLLHGRHRIVLSERLALQGGTVAGYTIDRLAIAARIATSCRNGTMSRYGTPFAVCQPAAFISASTIV